MQDIVKIFGLSQRDLNRSSRITTAADLGPKQLALCLSTCDKVVSAADLLEIGGEADSQLQSGCL